MAGVLHKYVFAVRRIKDVEISTTEAFCGREYNDTQVAIFDADVTCKRCLRAMRLGKQHNEQT